MNISKPSSAKRKIVLLIYVIINFVLFFHNDLNSVMEEINFIAFGYCALSEKIEIMLLILCFFICELVLLISLFIKKSTHKLVANIIFEVLCVVDICVCISSIVKGLLHVEIITEIILDLILIFLISFDIYKTYKKPIKQSPDDVS